MLPPRLFRWSLALLLAPLLALPSAAAEESPSPSEPLLRVEGELEDSDPTLSEDNTRYDEYRFEGQAGQTITIVLESIEFDTYLLLKDPAGQIIEQNDDYADGNKNSAITFTLPESGTYTIVTRAYSAESRGRYRLTVLAGSEPVFLLANEQIELLEQRLAEYRAAGDRGSEAKTLYNLGLAYRKLDQYNQALEHYQQALEIYRSLSKTTDEVFTLNAIGYVYLFHAMAVRNQGDYPSAHQLAEQGLVAFQEQLDLARSIPIQTQERQALTSIGQAYGMQADISDMAGNYPQALEIEFKGLEFLQQSLAISQKLQEESESRSTLGIIFNRYWSISRLYDKLGEYESALEAARNAQAVAVETKNPEYEYIGLYQELSVYQSISLAYNDPTQYERKLEANQRILVLAQKLNQPNAEIRALLNIAEFHRFQGRYVEASKILDQALHRARETSIFNQEMIVLVTKGLLSRAQADYAGAIKSLELALQISRSQGYLMLESMSINNIADIYQRQGDYEKAIESLQKSLMTDQSIYNKYSGTLTLQMAKDICRDMNTVLGDHIINPQTESMSRLFEDGNLFFNECQSWEQLPSGYYLETIMSHKNNITDMAYGGIASTYRVLGSVYTSQGAYLKALEFYQQALMMERENKKLIKESNVLNNIAEVYSKQGSYAEALNLLKQALEIAIAQKNHEGQITFLLSLGDVQRAYGNYTEAFDTYQKALELTEQSNARSRKAAILLSVSQAHGSQGDYAKALENANQALTIQQEIGEPANVALTLNAIGVIHRELGQFDQALRSHQQALDLTRKIGAGSQETGILLNIAAVYREQSEPDEALQIYQQALTIARSRGELETESIILTGIGKLYLSKAQPQDALSNLQQALSIQQQIGVRPSEADTLQAIGQAQTQFDQPAEAQTALQQSLILAKQIGDRATEAQALASLGQLLVQQNQPEVAIAFYKQAVNLTEQIRQGLQTLSKEQQATYTETVSDRYRELADLLISQGRLSEAQQVLELLKLEELREFTRSAATPGQSSGVIVLEVEQAILNDFDTFTAFAKQLYDCEQSRCAELKQLRDLLNARTIEFNQDINGFRKALQERLAQDPGFLTSDDLTATAQRIVTAEPGTVLVYPLVLPDKIRILLAMRAGSQGVIFRSFEVDVNQQTLWQTVAQFRQQLGEATPSGPVHSIDAVQATASQLYTWLIQPLEAELQAQGQDVRNLVFSLDRSTRYIPMAALYNPDTQQYLTQRYAVSTILSAGLTDTTDRLSANPSDNAVLAMGLSMPVDRFPALDNVPQELDSIIKTDATDPQGVYPGTPLLNQQFTFENLQNNLSGHRILHIASHAEFEAPPENSFILSAEGPIRLDQIQTLVQSGIGNIHLVVLSACQTGIGGPDSSGIEVPGISYYFLTNRAKAVMASLWNVNDRSTSLLMQQFYQNLASDMTKAEALQAAQRSLLEGQAVRPVSGSRADVEPRLDGTVALVPEPGAVPRGYAHPYYWAPFILIGNGL